MVQFTKLRLTGFKSFVDSTELVIDSGLTGIVGPNGCGKSNLVEALRWVMGETSAKSMRGGEMDDVIFAGNSGRLSRNVAEVEVVLDNADRKVPAMFNDFEQLEVRRANVDDYADAGLRDLGQLADLAGAPHRHLEHERLRVGRSGEHGERQADLRVEVLGTRDGAPM